MEVLSFRALPGVLKIVPQRVTIRAIESSNRRNRRKGKGKAKANTSMLMSLFREAGTNWMAGLHLAFNPYLIEREREGVRALKGIGKHNSFFSCFDPLPSVCMASLVRLASRVRAAS